MIIFVLTYGHNLITIMKTKEPTKTLNIRMKISTFDILAKEANYNNMYLSSFIVSSLELMYVHKSLKSNTPTEHVLSVEEFAAHIYKDRDIPPVKEKSTEETLEEFESTIPVEKPMPMDEKGRPKLRTGHKFMVKGPIKEDPAMVQKLRERRDRLSTGEGD